jgi:TetR/AcrR family transcriptional regulator
MATRSRDPARTREKILTHATAEFARKGFGGARVDSIAARCKLSKNMLYYYFQSKEGLFVGVLERMYERLRSEQQDFVIRGSDPITALKQLVDHTFAALMQNPDAISLMNEENRHKGRHIRQSRRMRDLYNPLVETIRLVLDKGVAEGAFRRDIDPAVMYLSLSSMCYHYLSNQYTLEVALGRDMRSEAARRRWIDHIAEMMVLFCTAGIAKSARAPRFAAPRRIA